MSVTVRRARIHRVRAGSPVLAARAIVGQRHVDRAAERIDRGPLGSVEPRRAGPVRRLARLDQHFGLRGEAVGRHQSVAAVDEFEPLPAPVRVEARHVEGAVVQQVAVGRAVRRIPGPGGDELVEVLEDLVVAHVERDTAVAADRGRRALLLLAAHRGALDRPRVRIVRIDLHDPAEVVGLVGVLRDVEARIDIAPLRQVRARRDAVARLVRRRLLATLEVGVEVLLAAEVGAPGRPARGAVGERADALAARRVLRGAHQRVARGRAADAHRRVAVDAARVLRRRDHPPVVAAQLDLDHAHPQRVLRLACLLARPVGGVVGEQRAVVGVLVVDREQAAPGARARVVAGRRAGHRRVGQREEVHAVVVGAGLQCLVVGGIRGVPLERRHAARIADGVTPADQDGRGVAVGNADGVLRGTADTHEAEARAGRQTGRGAGTRSCGAGRHAQRCGDIDDRARREPCGERARDGNHGAPQPRPAFGRFDDIGKARAGRWIVDDFAPMKDAAHRGMSHVPATAAKRQRWRETVRRPLGGAPTIDSVPRRRCPSTCLPNFLRASLTPTTARPAFGTAGASRERAPRSGASCDDPGGAPGAGPDETSGCRIARVRRAACGATAPSPSRVRRSR